MRADPKYYADPTVCMTTTPQNTRTTECKDQCAFKNTLPPFQVTISRSHNILCLFHVYIL
jgi:hypothetical protein